MRGPGSGPRSSRVEGSRRPRAPRLSSLKHARAGVVRLCSFCSGRTRRHRPFHPEAPALCRGVRSGEHLRRNGEETDVTPTPRGEASPHVTQMPLSGTLSLSSVIYERNQPSCTLPDPSQHKWASGPRGRGCTELPALALRPCLRVALRVLPGRDIIARPLAHR